jgi:hypothetical protein
VKEQTAVTVDVFFLSWDRFIRRVLLDKTELEFFNIGWSPPYASFWNKNTPGCGARHWKDVDSPGHHARSGHFSNDDFL